MCLIAFDLNNNSYIRVHAMWPHSTVLIPHTGPCACAPGLTPSVQRLSKSSRSRRSGRRTTSKCAGNRTKVRATPEVFHWHGKPATTRRSRKEVIQPQVPLRLPCYDFAPVTELTFGGCLLAVSPPTSGPPSFHGVTGGVYKARERIHRGVADPRLLAIPASCGRVADHNPNLDRLLAIGALLRVGDALYRPL